MVTEISEATSTAEQERPIATAELALEGMHCAACASRIEGALAQQPGVISAAVNFATTRAFVVYDAASVATDELCGAVEKAGYSAYPLNGTDREQSTEASEHWLARAIISWAISIIAFAIAVFGPQTAISGWSALILASVVEVVGGWPFFKAAIRLLRHGATGMDTLIVVGTLAALAVSAVEAIALGGRHVHLGGGGAFAARLHGVMGPLIISILATGRAIEQQARKKATRAMHSLLALRPPIARGRLGARGRSRRARPPREHPGRSVRQGASGRDHPPRRNRCKRAFGCRRVDAHR